jgi:uncharacterized protein YeaO (DUF488 family)
LIRHASIYDQQDAALDQGWRVLVMRYWPRGVRRERVDVWLKDAAPSRELLHAYSHEGLKWAQFARRYRREMRVERSQALDALRRLEREHGVITLLCHERIPPAEHCHRTLLAELLTPRRAHACYGEAEVLRRFDHSPLLPLPGQERGLG